MRTHEFSASIWPWLVGESINGRADSWDGSTVGLAQIAFRGRGQTNRVGVHPLVTGALRRPMARGARRVVRRSRPNPAYPQVWTVRINLPHQEARKHLNLRDSQRVNVSDFLRRAIVPRTLRPVEERRPCALRRQSQTESYHRSSFEEPFSNARRDVFALTTVYLLLLVSTMRSAMKRGHDIVGSHIPHQLNVPHPRRQHEAQLAALDFLVAVHQLD